MTTRTVFPLSGKAFVELRSFLGEGVGKERRGEGNELDTHSPICEETMDILKGTLRHYNVVWVMTYSN